MFYYYLKKKWDEIEGHKRKLDQMERYIVKITFPNL